MSGMESLEDDQLQVAWLNFVQSADDEDGPTRDALDHLCEEAARVDDTAADAAVAEMISENHAMSKRDAKQRIKRFRSEQHLEEYDYGRVTKIVSPITDVDPVYEIEMTVDGETETVRAEAGQIITFGRFQEEFFKKFDGKLKYLEDDEWDELLEEMFADENVEVREEYTESAAYTVSEAVISSFTNKEVVFSTEGLKTNYRRKVLYDESDDELLLPLAAVEQQMELASGDPDASAIRDVLEHRGYIADSEDPIREIPEAGDLRLWRLSPAPLVESGVIDADRLEDDGDDYEQN
jgi:hypothetical protein